MVPQKQLQGLLDAFADNHGITLKLDNGVCALRDEQGQEAVVLELPEGSTALLLHCQLFPMHDYHDSVPAWRLMMTLNFEMNAMRGCWLALDDDQQVRLCHQQSLTGLDETQFNDLLLAFMQQAREARALLLEMLDELLAAQPQS